MRQRAHCTAHRTDGSQCQGWAIHGGTVCLSHGGRTPQVKRAAQARMERAADPVVSALLDIVLNRDGRQHEDRDRIKAGLEILDRAGYGAVKKSEHDVSVTREDVGPTPEVIALIARERDRRLAEGNGAGAATFALDPASYIDAEVVDDSEPGDIAR